MQKHDLLVRISILFVFIVVFLGALYLVVRNNKPLAIKTQETLATKVTEKLNPLSIVSMRSASYPGSKIEILEELSNGTNYKQSVVSYKSDGLTIRALLTVPTTPKPKDGYPVVIFNHGYIPPTEYKTTERYLTYVDGFARNGYVVLKSDYRGHGSSEGNPEGAYFSPAYTVDVLNGLNSIKQLDYVDKNNIGMWGHSMGGSITQRIVVIDPSIKAAVIWGGVVGSYEDLFRDWWSKRRTPSPMPRNNEMNATRPSRQLFIQQFGEPTSTNEFWNSISATSYMQYLTTPIELHHGITDETVPYQLSQDYYDKLKKANKEVDVYFYEGNDHNISQSFNLAMQRSIAFFDKHLKGRIQ